MLVDPLSVYQGNVKITQQINNLVLAPLCTAAPPPTKGDVFPKPAQSEKNLMHLTFVMGNGVVCSMLLQEL